MGLMLQERRFAIDVLLDHRDGKNFKFSSLETAITGALLAVVLEELLPAIADGYTHDCRDYYAYALGAVYFYCFINRPRRLQLSDL